MAPEPNHRMDPLLRAYARKRRDDAGPALELHPATRRMLLAEVARHRPAPPWRFLTWMDSWATFIPRVAGAVGICVVIALVAWVLSNPATEKVQQLARGTTAPLPSVPAMGPSSESATPPLALAETRVRGDESAAGLSRDKRISQSDSTPARERGRALVVDRVTDKLEASNGALARARPEPDSVREEMVQPLAPTTPAPAAASAPVPVPVNGLVAANFSTNRASDVASRPAEPEAVQLAAGRFTVNSGVAGSATTTATSLFFAAVRDTNRGALFAKGASAGALPVGSAAASARPSLAALGDTAGPADAAEGAPTPSAFRSLDTPPALVTANAPVPVELPKTVGLQLARGEPPSVESSSFRDSSRGGSFTTAAAAPRAAPTGPLAPTPSVQPDQPASLVAESQVLMQDANSAGAGGTMELRTALARPNRATLEKTDRNDLAKEKPAATNAGQMQSAWSQYFRQTRLAEVASTGAGVRQQSRPFLESFDFEQTGNEVRIIDADGSVYSGAFTQGIDAAPASAKRVEETTRRLAVARPLSEPARGVTPLASGAAPFRLVGTNKTLRQRVVINGSLVDLTATNRAEMFGRRFTAQAPREKTEEAVGARMAVTLQTAQPVQTNLMVQGTVQMGAQQLRFEAQAAPR